MGKPVICTVMIMIVSILVSFRTVRAGGDYGNDLVWMHTGSESPLVVGELEGDEFGMESEISRRILATSKYISYGALRRNSVPCSRRGASYYNCQRGAQANPYSRGCSAITRCRG